MYHVANAVQSTQKQLATHLQQIQAMMQPMQMQYAAATHGTSQDYGGRQYYGGCGYHGNQSSYCSPGEYGSQNNGNWRGGRDVQANINLTHYCWIHGMCAHPVKYCRTLTGGHQKDMVWCNKMLRSERNCTLRVGLIPYSKTSVEEIKPSNTSELLCSSIVDPPQQATII